MAKPAAPALFDVPAAAGDRPAAGSAKRLGRYANNSSPDPQQETKEHREKRQGSRRKRYSLRYFGRQVTGLDRFRACGHTPVGGGDVTGIALRIGQRDGRQVAGLTGLAHCGSVWVCPVCSAKIATRRAEDLADLMRYALEQGCSASLVTLTVRHHKGQRLADTWDAVAKGWAAVTSGKQWVNDKQAAGLQGWVKTVEVTNGANGWHVHVHALLIWNDRGMTENAAVRIGQRMWGRWAKAVRKVGFDSIRDSGGLDVRIAKLKPGKGSGLHEYFVKLSHEITGGQAKLAKGHGRTPFQILSDLRDNGLAEDAERWWEWEESSHGRRQMSWSKGIREWAELGKEQTDEEIADEEIEGDDLVILPAASWHHLRADPDDVCDLLDVAERLGLAGAITLLNGWNVPWIPGKAAPPARKAAA